MKPNELRIGNYVELLGKTKELLYLTKHNGKNETVGYYAGFEKHIPVNFIHLRPIPLTEQWLIDFGFEKERKTLLSCYFYKDDFEIEIHGDKYVFRVYGGESAPHLTQFFAHHTRHVHQLQNLYFALTGEELKLNQSL